jgi:hypothetical protein
MSNGAANVVAFPTESNIQVRRYPLRDGDPGIAHTIKLMRALVEGREGGPSPEVRALALAITHGLSSRDKAGQIAAVLDWVKQNIDFRGEYKETLQSPVVTLQLKGGDCDDHSMLIAALLKSIGFKTRFTTVAADDEDPQQFSHVFAEALDPTTRQWTALDSTVPRSFPGWRPDNVYRTQSWKPMGDWTSLIAGDPMGTQQVDPSTGQILQNLLLPLDQALANKITYGDRTALGTGVLGTGNFTPAGTPASGIPGIFWILLGVGAWFMWRR